MDKQIILLTTFPARIKTFPDDLQRLRAKEFEQCLVNNCNTDIDRAIVFFEGDESDLDRFPSLSHAKVEVIFISERPKLSLFFDYANEHLVGHFVIVSNADVYFDQHTPVNRIREIKPNCLWALCRYVPDGQISYKWKLQGRGEWGSYDSYIFQAPLRKFNCDTYIGTRQSDSLLVNNAIEASIKVSSPCLSLVIKHLDSLAWAGKESHAPVEIEFQSKHSFENKRGRWTGPDSLRQYVYPYPSYIEDEAYMSRDRLMCRIALGYRGYRHSVRTSPSIFRPFIKLIYVISRIITKCFCLYFV